MHNASTERSLAVHTPAQAPRTRRAPSRQLSRAFASICGGACAAAQRAHALRASSVGRRRASSCRAMARAPAPRPGRPPRAPASPPPLPHLLPFVGKPVRAALQRARAPRASSVGRRPASSCRVTRARAHPRLGPGGRPVPQPRLLHSPIRPYTGRSRRAVRTRSSGKGRLVTNSVFTILSTIF
jgi:hypothetical protein